MKNNLISIIIPVYNGEKYIAICIDSLKRQTYTNWEAIVVNDGSSDNSLTILNDCSKSDSRIRVIIQENQGTAAARQTGIKHSCGNYITFIDIDDTIIPEALEIFITEALKNGSDIIVSSLRKKIFKKPHLKTMDPLEYLKLVLTGKQGWELCGKLYKRKLFDNEIIIPYGIKRCEDAIILVQLILLSKSISFCKEYVYCYVQNNNSVTHVRNEKQAMQLLEAGQIIEKMIYRFPVANLFERQLSSLYLLLFLRSTRYYRLKKNTPLVSEILKKHWKISSLFLIPLIKAIYLFLYRYFMLKR
jgi:glycosyltransferase involved in cell wall biosynthesis